MASRSAQSLDVLKQQRLVESAVPAEAIQKRKRTIILAILIQNPRKPQRRRLDHRPPQPGELFGEQSFQEGGARLSHEAVTGQIEDSRADPFIARVALAKALVNGGRRLRASGVLKRMTASRSFRSDAPRASHSLSK